MPTRCTHLNQSGAPCGGYAIRKTRLCFLHSHTPAKDAALKKGAAATNAKKLERAQQKLAAAIPGTIAVAQRAGLDSDQIASLDTLEGLKRWTAFVSGLLLEGKISAPAAQALFAGGRLAKDVQSLLNESRLLNVMEKKKARII